MTNLIKLSGICKSYDGRKKVLDNLEFSLNRGEIATIYGESGCGKSTFLNIVGLLDNCTEGIYFFDGHEISNKNLNVYQKIRSSDVGFIFQSYCLIDSISVYENIIMPLIYTEKEFEYNRLNELIKVWKNLIFYI